MTHEERAEIVERALELERCGELGALLVEDDEILVRLLAALHIRPEVRESGDHLTM